MNKISFITTNNFKFKHFTDRVKLRDISFEQLSVETPEIQAVNNREVAEFSAKWAADKFNTPVLKEDVGMYLHALGGFPGPYLSQVEKWIKSEGYLKLHTGETDRTAHWEYAIAYCEPGNNPISFFVQDEGIISTEIKGEAGWFTDKIFIQNNQTKTIGELLHDDAYIRKEDHYDQLKEYLLKQYTLIK